MTNTPPIYGVCVVQDEADVIRDSLLWAARFCQHLRVWDLGSTDGTWDILQSMTGDRIQAIQKQGLPYSSSLRGAIAAELRTTMEEGSWIYILDTDEFLVGDPAPVLAAAEQEGAVLVGAWQANFFPTRQTMADLELLGEKAWAAQSLARRFRYYRVEWFEWRFIRMIADLDWQTSGPYSAFRLAYGGEPPHSRKAMTVRHYRYRSPAQVARRFAARSAAHKSTPSMFRYETTGDFAKLVRPATQCREWPDPAADLIVPKRELLRARLHMGWTRVLRKIERSVRRLQPGGRT